MENEIVTKRYSARELEQRRDRDKSRTDTSRIHAQDDAAVERSSADDPDWSDVPTNWYDMAEAVMPAPKRLLSLRLDEDVVTWFRAQGPGYQTRMNAVLRAFVAKQQER